MQRAKDITQPSATVSSNIAKCKKDLKVLEVRLPNNSQKTMHITLFFYCDIWKPFLIVEMRASDIYLSRIFIQILVLNSASFHMPLIHARTVLSPASSAAQQGLCWGGISTCCQAWDFASPPRKKNPRRTC